MGSGGGAPIEKWLTPRRAFALLAVVIVAVLLLAPWPEQGARSPALSSYGAGPGGARGYHDILDRLGFRVERRLRPMRDSLSDRAVYAVLDPPVHLTASEVHLLLEVVRAGAGLLTLPTAGSGLADSLGLTRVAVPARPARAGDAAPAGPRSWATLAGGWVRWVLRRKTESMDSAAVFVPPAGSVTFLTAETVRGREPVIVGMPFGAGRLVVVSDPALLGNAELRNGGAVRAVRLAEWLVSGRPERSIVFDEYHHGFGTHANILRVTRRALFATAPGRVVVQLAFAGLLLLVAIGVRPIVPHPRVRIERRSPLEHVGALARAYSAVGATDRAARLLVRGLRRRHGRARGSADEAEYLREIGCGHAVADEDIACVTTAIIAPDQAQPADLASAITRIERAITT